MVLRSFSRVVEADIRYNQLSSTDKGQAEKQGANSRKRAVFLRTERLPGTLNPMAGNTSSFVNKRERSQSDDPHLVRQ
jgi:hypothetical protein